MRNIIAAFFELIRVIILIGLFLIPFGLLNSALVNIVYNDTIASLTENNTTLTFFLFLHGFGILLLLFLLYRNKLQQKGFYHNKSQKALSRKTSKILLALGISFILPFYFLLLY